MKERDRRARGLKCGPTGKRYFASKGAAESALREIRSRGAERKAGIPVRAYQCRKWCDGWHLTSEERDW